MKYISLLLAVAAGYFYLARATPVGAVAKSVTAEEVAPLTTGPREPVLPPTNALKRPLDRTHAVLEQVKTRNGAGEF